MWIQNCSVFRGHGKPEETLKIQDMRHFPVRWSEVDEGAHFTAMVRLHDQRAMSAYKFDMHAWNLGPELDAKLRAKKQSFAEFVRFPAVTSGCQVKQLGLETSCSRPVEELYTGPDMTKIRPEKVAEVLQKLERLGFAGLQELWETSICMFP